MVVRPTRPLAHDYGLLQQKQRQQRFNNSSAEDGICSHEWESSAIVAAAAAAVANTYSSHTVRLLDSLHKGRLIAAACTLDTNSKQMRLLLLFPASRSQAAVARLKVLQQQFFITMIWEKVDVVGG
jgi:hypothetical protein